MLASIEYIDGKEDIEPLDWKPIPDLVSHWIMQTVQRTFNGRQRDLLCSVKVASSHVLPGKSCPIGHLWLSLPQNFQHVIGIGVEVVKLDVDNLLSPEFDVY